MDIVGIIGMLEKKMETARMGLQFEIRSLSGVQDLRCGVSACHGSRDSGE